MLELDLVLSAFVTKHYPQLSEEQKLVFEQVLDFPDNELWDMIMGRVEPADRSVIPLLQLLRDS